jgi:hypothetical protein
MTQCNTLLLSDKPIQYTVIVRQSNTLLFSDKPTQWMVWYWGKAGVECFSWFGHCRALPGVQPYQNKIGHDLLQKVYMLLN